MPLWLPEGLHNSSTLFPFGKFNIHGTKLDQELKQVCLDGQAVVSWTLGYQGLVVMWSGHRGKVAEWHLPLYVFTFSFWIRANRKMEKQSPRGEMEKLAPSHPFLPLSLPGLSWSWAPAQLVGNERYRDISKRCCWYLGDVPERLCPLTVSLPFHLWQQWAMNLLLSPSYPPFLSTSLPFPLFFTFLLKCFITIHVKIGENDHDWMWQVSIQRRDIYKSCYNHECCQKCTSEYLLKKKKGISS